MKATIGAPKTGMWSGAAQAAAQRRHDIGVWRCNGTLIHIHEEGGVELEVEKVHIGLCINDYSRQSTAEVSGGSNGFDVDSYDDCTTTIFILTEQGLEFSSRMARQLINERFIIVWPHEARHVLIERSLYHRIIPIGASARDAVVEYPR